MDLQDQPYNGLAMITAFTRGQSLVGMDGVVAESETDTAITATVSSRCAIQN